MRLPRITVTEREQEKVINEAADKPAASTIG